MKRNHIILVLTPLILSIVTACSDASITKAVDEPNAELNYREKILTRAQEWLLIEDGGTRDTPIAYSQEVNSGLDGYRADSSGYISYAWDLIPSKEFGGLSIYGLQQYAFKISIIELMSGDILLTHDGNTHADHGVIFVEWIDKAEGLFVAYEENSNENFNSAVRTSLILQNCTYSSCEIVEDGRDNQGPYNAFRHPNLATLTIEDESLLAELVPIEDVIKIPEAVGYNQPTLLTTPSVINSQERLLITPDLEPITSSNASQLELLVTIGRIGNATLQSGFDQHIQGSMEDIAWSPDNQFVAIGSSLGVDIYDSQDWTTVSHLESSYPVKNVDFVDDGNYLIASGLGVLSTDSWSLDQDIFNNIHSTLNQGYSVSPDDKLIAYPAVNGVDIFDLGSLEKSDISFPNGPPYPHIYGIEFSPDGALIAIVIGESTDRGYYPNSVYLYRTNDFGLQSKIPVLPENIGDISFTGDGSIMATTSSAWDTRSSRLRLWSTATGVLLHEFNSSSHSYGWLSPTSDLLVVSQMTCTDVENGRTRCSFEPLEIYDVSKENFTLIHQIDKDDCRFVAWNNYQSELILSCNSTLRSMDPVSGETTQVGDEIPNKISFSNGGESFIGYWPDKLMLWNEHDQEDIPSMDFLGELKSMDLSPDNQYLALGTTRHGTIVWRLSDGEIVYEGAGTQVAFSPDGSLLAVYKSSGELRFVETNIWTDSINPDALDILISNLPGDLSRNFKFSPNGKLFATRDSYVFNLFDRNSFSKLTTLGANNFFSDFLFSPDNSLLAINDSEVTVDIWNIEQGKVITHIETSNLDNIRYILFTPDGSELLIAKEEVFQLWSTTTGELIKNINLPDWGFRLMSSSSPAFTHDGTLLFINGHGKPDTQSSYYSLLVFDITTDQPHLYLEREFQGSTPDETVVFTASGIFDLVTGNTLFSFEIPLRGLDRIEISLDGRLLVIMKQKGVVEIWGVKAD